MSRYGQTPAALSTGRLTHGWCLCCSGLVSRYGQTPAAQASAARSTGRLTHGWCLCCRGSAAQLGVALLTDVGCASFCCAIDWPSDSLKWLKAPRPVVEGISHRGFDAVFAQTAELTARGAGPAALRATEVASAAAPAPADSLWLRVLLDGSAVEVFTGTGQTVSTRVYSSTADGAVAGERSLQLLCLGGPAEVAGAAWEMQSAWL